MTQFNNKQMAAIVAEAKEAGHKAAIEAGKHLQTYTVRDGFSGRAVGQLQGLCGFAWVNVKPGTSRFAKYLKQNKLARPDSYYGGVTIWVRDYQQSVDMKEAYARAYASVLQNHGIKAYSASRLD